MERQTTERTNLERPTLEKKPERPTPERPNLERQLQKDQQLRPDRFSRFDINQIKTRQVSLYVYMIRQPLIYGNCALLL